MPGKQLTADQVRSLYSYTGLGRLSGKCCAKVANRHIKELENVLKSEADEFKRAIYRAKEENMENNNNVPYKAAEEERYKEATETIRERKAGLEENIRDLLKKFEEDTNIVINNVYGDKEIDFAGEKKKIEQDFEVKVDLEL